MLLDRRLLQILAGCLCCQGLQDEAGGRAGGMDQLGDLRINASELTLPLMSIAAMVA